MNGSIGEAFSRVSARERRLLGVLALAALVIAPVYAFKFRAESLAENEAAHTALAEARAKARLASGSGVAARLDATRRDVREWSWTAPSVAVGQVIAQDRLADLAARGGLTEVKVRPSGKAQAAGEVTLVGVEVKAPFNWSGLSGFLTGLSAEDKGFILESVKKTDDETPQLIIVVRLPIVIGDVVEEGAPA